MNEFSQINSSVIKRFLTLAENNKLAHAYLFVGPSGTGKFATAVGLAKTLNCEKNRDKKRIEFCGQCSPCKRIESRNHPDVRLIEGEFAESIKIEAVRDIISQIQLRPFEADRKIVIIENIDNLTVEGGNALLKTLEEPSGDTLLIMTTSVAERVLGTIRSRCHAIYFYPLSCEKLATVLASDYDIKENTAHFLAHFSEGSCGKALLLNDNGVYKSKNEIIDDFLFSKGHDGLIKKVVADKEKTKELLDVLLSWFRDLMLIKAGLDDLKVIHKDRIKDLRRTKENFTFEELENITSEIVKTTRLLNDNLNVKIALNVIKEQTRTV